MLKAPHTRSGLLQVLPPQQGLLEPPQVSQRPEIMVLQINPPLQVLPLQQGCSDPPQVSQTTGTKLEYKQPSPALQVPPLQQGWPLPPQVTTQRPLEQV